MELREPFLLRDEAAVFVVERSRLAVELAVEA